MSTSVSAQSSVPAPTQTEPNTVPSRLIASLIGLVAAGSGLATGELLASVDDRMLSPVIGVGNRAIDLVPPPVKRFAISTFGTYDKLGLLIGIGLAIVVFAAVVGLVARKRKAVALLGLAAFGALGMAAALTGRGGGLLAAIPSLVAALVAMVALLVMLRSVTHERVQVVDSELLSSTSTSITRRNVLAVGGFAALAVAMGTTAQVLKRGAVTAAKKAVRALPLPKRTLPVIPVSAGVAELVEVTPFITPNKDFYRIDTALVVPRVNINDWTLKITGMVGKERTYTYDDLLSMDLIEQDITLTCVSNEVGGILMGNARWLGVPLMDLLEEAGIDPGASQIVGRSVDDWSAGFPIAALRKGSKAIVAIGMNGEPLPFDHGYPARLVVPGIYGYASATKWLDTIELTTMDGADGYWVPRGYAKEAPIKMGSRIDVPRGLTTVEPGLVAVAGIAWSQTVGISRVEVKIDNGEWQEAELADEVDIDTWRQWKFAWQATTGQHEITVRTFDKNAKLQIEDRVAPLPNGATGWHQVLVFVS
jgi:DMSO/TMAO reductase YedYZ molybdopterin-dependent catalytic subunit